MTSALKEALVIGEGISGKAAANLLKKRGFIVTTWDSRSSITKPSELLQKNFERVVISPGIALNKGEFADWPKKLGTRLWSEIDLALEGCKSPIIAITGTNGKSTVTSLIGHILSRNLADVFMGGNLGTPPSSWWDSHDSEPSVWVLEISSYQMETSFRLRPTIGIVTNLAPNHLDRYHSAEDYYDTKWLLLQQTQELAIFRDDGNLCSARKKSINVPYVEIKSETKRLSTGDQIPEFHLPGKHNLENLFFAIEACLKIGISWKKIQESIPSFQPLPHRLQLVRTFQGVQFYNDSKSTTVASILTATNSLSTAVRLLCGGRSKGDDFTELRSAKNISGIYPYGEYGPSIGKALNVSHFPTMKEAFQEAFQNSKPGDAILLSPGCSSFDQFKNFEERGDFFTQLAQEIK